MRWIGELRGLGLAVAEIRDLTSPDRPDWRRSFGPRLAERLRVSRRRLQARIAQLEETLQRVDAFESAYRAELASDGNTCWADDPRCPMDRNQIVNPSATPWASLTEAEINATLRLLFVSGYENAVAADQESDGPLGGVAPASAPGARERRRPDPRGDRPAGRAAGEGAGYPYRATPP